MIWFLCFVFVILLFLLLYVGYLDSVRDILFYGYLLFIVVIFIFFLGYFFG